MGKKLRHFQLEYPIILFDGVCNLCNRTVNFIIRHDQKRRFRFVALQSEWGEMIKKYYKIPNQTDSVIVIFQGKSYFESEAVLFILGKMGFPWKLVYGFSIIPTGISNSIYRWIANNRYRWFGVKDSCRVPDESEKEYFPEKLKL